MTPYQNLLLSNFNCLSYSLLLFSFSNTAPSIQPVINGKNGKKETIFENPIYNY